MAADDRVLGDGDFVEQVWSESAELDREILRRKGPVMDLEALARFLGVTTSAVVRAARAE
jgi:hypothetical protein